VTRSGTTLGVIAHADYRRAASRVTPWGALSDCVRHRAFVAQMVRAELRGRYAGSALGIFWSVVHPLVLIGTYTFVFTHVMRARLPGDVSPYAYSVFLCAGMLPWLAFQEVLMRATSIFLEQRNLLKKIALPPAVVHAYVVTGAGVNLIILTSAFAGLLLLLGQPVHWTLAAWPLFLALELLFAAGLGLIASVLGTLFRDLIPVVGVGVYVWFWLTPIVYPAAILPDRYAVWLPLNPLYLFTRVHQNLVLTGTWPTLPETTLLIAASLGTLAGGLYLLGRVRERILDEL
jgi:lipopolysaccharide transport system permease protein